MTQRSQSKPKYLAGNGVVPDPVGMHQTRLKRREAGVALRGLRSYRGYRLVCAVCMYCRNSGQTSGEKSSEAESSFVAQRSQSTTKYLAGNGVYLILLACTKPD